MWRIVFLEHVISLSLGHHRHHHSRDREKQDIYHYYNIENFNSNGGDNAIYVCVNMSVAFAGCCWSYTMEPAPPDSYKYYKTYGERRRNWPLQRCYEYSGYAKRDVHVLVWLMLFSVVYSD